jgi:pimeloyl-ACP methyl ester carboxylesterase
VVLFLHGVEDGSSGQGYSREAFDAAHLGFGVQAHHGWLDDGWNVGAFYWNQFADEANPLDAEAKIWTAHGPRGMRYRLNDRTYGTALAPDTPVGELLYAAFLSALAGNTSRNIRLAGHSLGAELACYLGARIMEDCRAGLISDRYMIRRIAMIEPAWSPDCRAYLGDGDGRGDSPAGRVMAALEGMVRDWGGRNGFCFEVYSSTALEYLVENPVTQLSDMAGGTVRLRLDCFRAGEIKRRHRSAYLYYFASYSFAPPPECVARGGCARPTGDFAPSAATPDARVAERMGCGEAWEQAGGTDTFTPADDWFERR